MNNEVRIMPRTEDYESWCDLEKDNAYMAKMKAELDEE